MTQFRVGKVHAGFKISCQYQNKPFEFRLTTRLKNKFWRSGPYGGSNLVYYAHFEYHESSQLLRSSENERVQKIAKSHKILFFCDFWKNRKSTFFQFELENRVLGLRKWSIRKKRDFFSIIRIFKFYLILATFDLVLSRKREESIWNFVKNQESGHYVSHSKLGQK